MNPPLFENSLPNFFILGAAKAGTTTLYDLLRKLPEVYFPFSKEPLFFSQDRLYNKGIDWYIQTFYHNASTYQLRGDATPHYLFWSEKVAPRIRYHYPTAPKLIVLLRDPTERAYSWYWNMIREGRENLSFEDALTVEKMRIQENYSDLRNQGSMVYGYIQGSRYASLLRPYLQIFPIENFHFILHEDLRVNLDKTMSGVLEFLGLPSTNRNFKAVTSNSAALPRNRDFHKWLRKQSEWRERLKPLIPIKIRYTIKEKLIKLNLRSTNYKMINPETEKSLRIQFVNETLDLQQIIGRDLSAWLPE